MNESLKGLRVLIAEDEALLAEELCLRLSRLGLVPLATVDTADNAVKAALSLKPDLILMDIRLKGPMDGVQATEVITSITSIPTVFLTAHSDPETLQRAKEAQPYGYVLKPYNERDLIVTLEMALLRHQLDRRLKASERRFSATLDSIRDGVLAIGADGLVNYINPVAAQLTGWSMKDASGLPVEEIFQLLDEDSEEPQENLLSVALRSSSPVRTSGPSLLVDRQGGTIPVEASAAPIRDNHSSDNLGAVLAFQDLRERRLAKEKLEKTEEQLQLAQRMEAVAHLSGGLAHDFNNLLTIICCHAELLLFEEDLSTSSRELVDEIQRAGQQGSTITRRLLSFSRQQVVQPEPLSLEQVLEEMGKVLLRLLGHHIDVSLSWENELPQIEADPRQLEQIVLNLAINARDAMPQGGSLKLRAERAASIDSDGEVRQEVKLIVADTGNGISPEALDKIFEPLYTTKEAGIGSGLGLTTVKGIMDQSHGRIEVTSETGEGTCFSLYFPAITGDDNLRLPRSEGVSPLLENGLDTSSHSETVLLVDDQPAVRASVSAVLRSRGYVVYDVSSGEQALQLIRSRADSFDLVITDVEMPAMNGRELANRVRALCPDMRVLFLSAHTRSSLLRKSFLEGREHFIQKPFDVQRFLSLVNELIKAPTET